MKVCILTLGCKVNQYESNSLAKALEEKGFAVSFSIEKADAYILNTCAVTNEAERKSRGMIAKIRKVSGAPIFVCGCSSQNAPEKFASYENIACVFGTSNKFELPDLICKRLAGEKDTVVHSDISKKYENKYLARGERTRAVIKIQDGCNNFCSYCLIPYLRGRERSRSLASVKTEVSFAAKTNKEIVFTGINLSAYGKDLEGDISLKDVAIMMREFPKVRFQFSSLEQDIINKEFLQTLKETPTFCPHFHLSLQSGCDKTLKLMNRKYDSKTFLSKVRLIRKFFKDAAITTDVIVGFPSETDEDFEKCYEFCKKCAFAKMHIFPFSPRSGTVAAKMQCVATNVKERCQKLAELDKQMTQAFITSVKGELNVLVETMQDDMFVGHSENYIKCYIKGKDIPLNSFVKVKIEKPYKDGAIVNIASY